jgi:hypothetical protein
LTNGGLKTNGFAPQAQHNTQLKNKKYTMTMVPPPHRIPAASILTLGKIAVSHAILNNHHNTAIQLFLMLPTIS